MFGSNDNYFWFWSKRMDPPVLHYARHEELAKNQNENRPKPDLDDGVDEFLEA
jgi:hypothetical protein